MRVDLDLDSGIVSAPYETKPFSSLEVSLSDGPIVVRLMRSGMLAQLIPKNDANPAKLQFIARLPGNFTPGTDIVAGSNSISSQQSDPALYPLLTCGEDWSATALTDLFAAVAGVLPSRFGLQGQYQWTTQPSLGSWYKSRIFNISVRNTFFALGGAGQVIQFTGSQKGLIPIPVDAAAVDIPFSPAFGSAPYLDVQVLKPSGGDNIFATPVQDLITTAGATVELSASPSIAGHYLSWLAYI